MNLRHRLLLVTDEADTVGAVASALGQNGRFEADCVCRDLRQLVERLNPGPCPAALVDIDPHPRRMLAELDPIITRFPETRFVILSSDRRDDLMLEAMQIGARNYLLKQAIPVDLPPVVERLVAHGHGSGGRQGALISVLSSAGGCGATTVAVHVADEFAVRSSQAALLVDLDCCYGGLASYLGLDGRYGIADVLANPGRLDPVLITSTAMVYSDRLEVLISPASTNLTDPSPPQFQHIGDVLAVFRQTYPVTVVDAPRAPIDVMTCLGRASDLIVVIFQMTVKDIQRARAMMTALTDRGIPPQRMLPLANRYQRRHAMISIGDVSAALGSARIHLVRNDVRSAARSLNYGKPLADVAPRSRLRRDLCAVAAAVGAAVAPGRAIRQGR